MINDIFIMELRLNWPELFLGLILDGISMRDFLPKFFNSAYMKHVDNRNPYYTSMQPMRILEELNVELVKIEKLDYDPFVVHWLGEFYPDIMSKFKLTGSEVYRNFPLTRMINECRYFAEASWEEIYHDIQAKHMIT